MPQTSRKNSFAKQLGGFTFASGMSALFKTLDVRITHYDKSCNPAIQDFSSPVIWVFWHEYILGPVASWHNLDITMLVSKHRDANPLVDAADRQGWITVRGSTNKGGTEAIRELKKLVNSPGIGITPDGPQGPRREMALGAVYLASRLGLPLVVIGVGFNKPWRLRSWDRFAIPKPGTRCRLVMGPRIHVPRKAGREELESYRVHVQQVLNQATTTAEQWAASKAKMQGEMIFERNPNRNWRNGQLMSPGTTSIRSRRESAKEASRTIDPNSQNESRRAA